MIACCLLRYVPTEEKWRAVFRGGIVTPQSQGRNFGWQQEAVGWGLNEKNVNLCNENNRRRK